MTSVIITTVNSIFQCSYNARTVLSRCSFSSHRQFSFNSLQDYCSKSTIALAMSKFYVDPSALSLVRIACLSKFVCMNDMFLLYSKRKFIRHCINQNQPPNLL